MRRRAARVLVVFAIIASLSTIAAPAHAGVGDCTQGFVGGAKPLYLPWYTGYVDCIGQDTDACRAGGVEDPFRFASCMLWS